MNRRLTLALVAPALLLAACGGEDEPAPKAETQATVKAIPSPSPDEAQAFMPELEKIIPGVSVDRGKAIDAARGTCDSILGGAQNLEQATATRFTVGLDVDQVSEAQAQRIVELVRGQAWCK